MKWALSLLVTVLMCGQSNPPSLAPGARLALKALSLESSVQPLRVSDPNAPQIDDATLALIADGYELREIMTLDTDLQVLTVNWFVVPPGAPYPTAPGQGGIFDVFWYRLHVDRIDLTTAQLSIGGTVLFSQKKPPFRDLTGNLVTITAQYTTGKPAIFKNVNE